MQAVGLKDVALAGMNSLATKDMRGNFAKHVSKLRKRGSFYLYIRCCVLYLVDITKV